MPDIQVYSGPNCPFCDRAKALLKSKNHAFEEYDVKADADRLAEMLERSGGRRTIPQIFINGTHVGGCDDLYELHAKGKLDELVNNAG